MKFLALFVTCVLLSFFAPTYSLPTVHDRFIHRLRLRKETLIQDANIYLSKSKAANEAVHQLKLAQQDCANGKHQACDMEDGLLKQAATLRKQVKQLQLDENQRVERLKQVEDSLQLAEKTFLIPSGKPRRYY